MAARAWPEADPVDAIMAIMERAFDPEFGEAWSRRQVSDALLLGTCNHLLIARDGTVGKQCRYRPAGFCLSRSVVDEDELLLFAIDPPLRDRGLGTALLAGYLQSARDRGIRRVFLEMRQGNTAARLYEKAGFRIIGQRPGYYRGARGGRYDALSQELILH